MIFLPECDNRKQSVDKNSKLFKGRFSQNLIAFMGAKSLHKTSCFARIRSNYHTDFQITFLTNLKIQQILFNILKQWFYM